MKTILVTGVAGFIGSNLAGTLINSGYRVLGVDDMSHGFKRNLAGIEGDPNFSFYRKDIRDTGVIQDLVGESDAVFHLAAYKIPRYGNAYDTLKINTIGTRAVLDAASRSGSTVIFASTSDVYGRNPQLPFHEQSDLWMGPSNVKRWSYAVSKIYDEHLCFAYQEEMSLPVVIVRFFGGYGPHQNTSWMGGPQSVFTNAALRNDEMEIHGDGRQTRSFTYVSDLVDGLMRCLDNPDAVGEVFNLGSTEEITIIDLATLVWRLAGQGDPKLRMVSYRTFGKYEDVNRRVPDITKARAILGFEPKVGLEEGLRRTIEWQRALGVYDDRSGDSA